MPGRRGSAVTPRRPSHTPRTATATAVVVLAAFTALGAEPAASQSRVDRLAVLACLQFSVGTRMVDLGAVSLGPRRQHAGAELAELRAAGGAAPVFSVARPLDAPLEWM